MTVSVVMRPCAGGLRQGIFNQPAQSCFDCQCSDQAMGWRAEASHFSSTCPVLF